MDGRKKTCSTAPGAWTPTSRLSCQAILANEDVTIEIPKYSINHAKKALKRGIGHRGGAWRKSQAPSWDGEVGRKALDARLRDRQTPDEGASAPSQAACQLH